MINFEYYASQSSNNYYNLGEKTSVNRCTTDMELLSYRALETRVGTKAFAFWKFFFGGARTRPLYELVLNYFRSLLTACLCVVNGGSYLMGLKLCKVLVMCLILNIASRNDHWYSFILTNAKY